MLKQDQSWINNNISFMLGSAFLSFLVVDTSIGIHYYPRRFQIMTGWVHHVVYIWIITEFLLANIPGLLGTLCVLEIPTFALALGNLNSRWRVDKLFGFLFFVTRVFYHFWLIVKMVTILGPTSRFTGYFALSFPVHVYWFKNWVNLQLKSKSIKYTR
jgi:hypothetical protein